jgi:hypothetical protein
MIWCPGKEATPVPEVTRYMLRRVFLSGHDCYQITGIGLAMRLGREDETGFEPLDRMRDGEGTRRV